MLECLLMFLLGNVFSIVLLMIYIKAQEISKNRRKQIKEDYGQVAYDELEKREK